MSMTYNELVDKVVDLELQVKNLESAINTIGSETGAIAKTSDVAMTVITLNEYIRTLNSALRIAKKLGLPDNFDDSVATIQRMIHIIKMLELSYHLLAIAEISAGNPLAIIRAGISVVSLGIECVG